MKHLISLLLLGAALPALAAEQCQYIKVKSVPLTYAGMKPTIEGHINGKAVPMLLDTGAHRTYLFRSAAEQTGAHVAKLQGQMMAGVGGYNFTYITELNEFSIGGVRPSKGKFLVADDLGGRSRFSALVGRDYLFQMDMELNLAEKKAEFFFPKNCSDSHLAYWDANAMVLPFEGDFNRSKTPLIEIQINGKNVTALLDSGASSTMLDLAMAERIGITPTSPGAKPGPGAVGAGSDAVKTWYVPVKNIRVGSESLDNQTIVIGDLGAAGRDNAQMLLGQDFLRAHRVLFAISQRKIYLSPLGGEVIMSTPQQRLAWVQQEAADGNPDAMMQIARYHLNGDMLAKDVAKGRALIDQAAALGLPDAKRYQASHWLATGKFGEAASTLKQLSEDSPQDLMTAIWAYVAAARNGADLGAANLGLKAAAQRWDKRAWPMPAARFLTGEIDEASLQTEGRACSSAYFAGMRQLLQQQPSAARPYFETAKSQCADGSLESRSTLFELQQLTKAAP